METFKKSAHLLEEMLNVYYYLLYYIIGIRHCSIIHKI